MLDANYISKRISCTHEEKLECLETVKKLYHYARYTRINGLLAVSDLVELEPDIFLCECVETMSSYHDDLTPCLESYLIVGNYTGKEFLKNLIIVKTCFAMAQSGAIGLWIMNDLKCWFGVEFSTTYQREMDTFMENYDINVNLKREKNLCTEFDETEYLTNKQILFLVENLGERTLALALKCSSKQVREHFLKSLPSSPMPCKERLETEIFMLHNVRLRDVENAQNKVVSFIEANFNKNMSETTSTLESI